MIRYKDAADLLGVSQSGLRKWVMLRKVPFYKPAGVVLFDRDELTEWVQESRVAPERRPSLAL